MGMGPKERIFYGASFAFTKMWIFTGKIETARLNNANAANINSNEIIGEGSFWLVTKGEFTSGRRTGQPCVSK
jgi:hypothetical protein